MISTSRKEKNLSSLIKDADIAFGNYIKSRDTKDGVIRCFICGKVVPRNQCEAMHFIDRDQMPVRFDEMNVHAGDKDCNRFDPDHKQRYGAAMDAKYSTEDMVKLHYKSRSLAKFTRFEIGEIISEYELKTKALTK